MQITNNSSGSGVKVNLIKGVSSEAIAEALIRINEQELNIIGYESQTKAYRDETSVLRDNAQVSANNANVSATNANNSALLSTTKANEAILSANNALTYRNEAETFKTNAKVSEINADLRATAASTSEVNAKSSELLALQYKNTTLSIKDETLLLKNETVSNAITATEQATISTSNAIIAEQQAQIATTKASESLVNANNAKASELLSAQYKADNESIKTNVQTLSNSAYDSANTASIKANEASDSAIVSTTQANISITKASEASTYATNSNTSAVNALASENKAEEWASKEYGLEVEPGLYSAKHYATESNNALISMNSSVNPLANTVVKRDNNSDILTRTLNTTIESTSDIATKYYVETNNDGYLRPKVLSDVRTEIAGDKVTKTGNETIDGIKTFVKSPIVPTPINGNEAVNKDYVDSSINPTPIITTGTATFTATTNNINLTGIGIGVEIGDVIQISGADDAKNNSKFTVEVITDNNNIIVNQAHANKGTSKNVANRSGDTGVTVKLLAKYYNAPLGLGQAWVNMSGSRTSGPVYPNTTGRTIEVIGSTATNDGVNITVDGFMVYSSYSSGNRNSATILVPSGSMYSIAAGSSWIWGELR